MHYLISGSFQHFFNFNIMLLFIGLALIKIIRYINVIRYRYLVYRHLLDRYLVDRYLLDSNLGDTYQGRRGAEC